MGGYQEVVLSTIDRGDEAAPFAAQGGREKHLVQKCFEIWNTGDPTELSGLLSPGFVEHSHPDEDPSWSFDRRIRARSAGKLPAHIFVDAVLGDGPMIMVVGRTSELVGGENVVHDMVWRFRVGDLIEEIWSYRNLDVVPD